MSNNANNNRNEMGVTELVNDIRANLTQASASTRDEITVMRAMLNDRDFYVTTYNNDGSTVQHCPAEDFRKMTAGIVASTAKISQNEADALVAGYECKKSDAETMVGLSKDFINTALRTGRKINFGGTEHSNISIQLKNIPESTKRYPRKNGVNADGTPKYEDGVSVIPAHEGLKVTNPCPTWVK